MHVACPKNVENDEFVCSLHSNNFSLPTRERNSYLVVKKKKSKASTAAGRRRKKTNHWTGR